MAIETLVKNPTPVTIVAPYAAIIYNPEKELTQNALSSLFAVRSTQRSPFCRYFQIFWENAPQVFMLHPGSNMGYHLLKNDDQEIIKKMPVGWVDELKKNTLDNALIANGSLLILSPFQETALTPQYADFSDTDALLLVQAHTHERWIDSALQTETRTLIKTAAETQKSLILKERKKRAEGQ